GLALGAVERLRPAEEVERAEREVGGEVCAARGQEVTGPGHGQERVVDAQGLEERQPLPDHVERAVAVQEAAPVLLDDAAPEAQVLVEVPALFPAVEGARGRAAQTSTSATAPASP